MNVHNWLRWENKSNIKFTDTSQDEAKMGPIEEAPRAVKLWTTGPRTDREILPPFHVSFVHRDRRKTVTKAHSAPKPLSLRPEDVSLRLADSNEARFRGD